MAPGCPVLPGRHSVTGVGLSSGSPSPCLQQRPVDQQTCHRNHLFSVITAFAVFLFASFSQFLYLFKFPLCSCNRCTFSSKSRNVFITAPSRPLSARPASGPLQVCWSGLLCPLAMTRFCFALLYLFVSALGRRLQTVPSSTETEASCFRTCENRLPGGARERGCRAGREWSPVPVWARLLHGAHTRPVPVAGLGRERTPRPRAAASQLRVSQNEA